MNRNCKSLMRCKMNSNKLYCMKCGFIENYKNINKIKTYEINGEKITCEVNVKICMVCGEELSGEKTIDEELKIFREEYKRCHNLLTSEEIKEIRKKLGMTQKEFANYLGFGEKTITRYELGQIQEVANDNLMRLALSTDTMNMVLKERILTKTLERKISACRNRNMLQRTLSGNLSNWSKNNIRRVNNDCCIGVA